MDVVGISALAVVAAILSVMLRRYHGEYGMLLSIGCVILLLLAVLQQISPAVRQIYTFLEASGIPQEYILILFKALGICYLTQFAADSCRDAGESALAVKTEIAGRVAVLLVSLPLLSQVASIAADLIGG